MRIILVLIAVLLAAACSTAPAPPPKIPVPETTSIPPFTPWNVGGKYQKGYPWTVVNTFMTDCTTTDNVSVATCTCGMDYFMQNVPYARFVQDGTEAARGITPPDVAASVRACSGSSGGGDGHPAQLGEPRDFVPRL